MSILKAVGGRLGHGAVNKSTPATLPDFIDVDPSEYRGNLSDMFFWGDNGKEYRFSYSGHESSLKAYVKCPPLSAIINRKAQAHINGKTWVMNKDGKESQNEYARKIRKLFARPNPMQSWKQFEAQQKIYMQLFGFCIVLPIIPAGFEKYGPVEASSIWNIPPYMLDVEETNKIFFQTDLKGIVKHIKLNYKGVTTNLPLDSIYIFKDFTPSFNSLILPDSRVSTLQMPINNIIGALESRNELISYAGSQGIISPDSGSGQFVGMPLGDDDKKSLQDDFRRQYGIRKGQFRYIISPAAIKWQAMGAKTKDLLLIEEVTESSKSICDSYGYPPHLLGLIDPTFNNQAAAEKGFYQNTVIPEAESMYEEWNNFFRTADYNICIDKDYSHLPILQEDKAQQATARKTLDEALSIEYAKGLITLDDWLIEIGKDPLPNGLGRVRATDPGSSNVPLAVTIGVGGVQGLITVLTAQGLSDSARQSILEVVFGVASTDASRMVVTDTPSSTETTEPINTPANGN